MAFEERPLRLYLSANMATHDGDCCVLVLAGDDLRLWMGFLLKRCDSFTLEMKHLTQKIIIIIMWRAIL